MNRLHRRPWAVALNAALVANLVAGPALAQSIPGLGGQTQPKVMIIFDTSKSMEHLPSFDPLSNVSTPNLGNRGISYLTDDFNPNGFGPDSGCDNRFCVAKSVLYNTLPNYADSVQMGIAGYFQYRTRFAQVGGTTTCAYDVLAGPGLSSAVSRSTPVPNGATTVDPTNGECSNAGGLHSYPISSTRTAGGMPVNCVTYSSAGSSFSGNSGGRSCGNINFSAPSNPVRDNFGGTNLSPNLWIAMRAGTNACPAPGNSVLGYGDAATDSTIGAAGNVSTSGRKFLTDPSGDTRVFDPNSGGLYADLRSACIGTASNAQCRFLYTGTAQQGSERASQYFWNNTGNTITANGKTYTLRSELPDSPWTLTANANNAGNCVWPGTNNPALAAGATRVLNSLTGFGGIPTSPATPDCAFGGIGCKVTFENQVTGNAGGQYVPNVAPTSPQYTLNQPAGIAATCNVSNQTTQLAWSRAIITARVTVPPATNSCPNRPATNSNAGVDWSGGTMGVPNCSAATPCQFSPPNNQSPDTTPDPAVYLQPLANPGNKFLISGTPTLASRFVDLTTAGGAAQCGGYPNGNADLPATVAGCPAPGGCPNAKYVGYSATGGQGGATQKWGSNTPASYTDAQGVTYSNPTAGAPENSAYLIEKDGTVNCSDPQSIVAGAAGTVSCSPDHPCNLTPTGEVCRRISNGMVGQDDEPCPQIPDSTFKRYCSYSVTPYTYSAPSLGRCEYQVSEYRYAEKQCTYNVNEWTPETQACNGTTRTCNFKLSGYEYTTPNPTLYCAAYANKYTYSGVTPTDYVYEYKTKGGEYLGSRAFSIAPTPAENYCALGTSGYSQLAPYCPETIDVSNAGSASLSAEMKATCGVASGTGTTTCKLRWRSAPSSTGPTIQSRLAYRVGASNFGLPGYEDYDATVPRCLAPDRIGGEVSAPLVSGLYSNGQFCSGTGGTGQEIRLRSDYYEPTRANALPSASVPNADAWTNQPAKASGWSRVENGPSTGTPHELFIAPAAGTVEQIKKALTQCVRPTDLTSPPAGGLCISDTDNCGAPGAPCNCPASGPCQSPLDYTPLNGSLVNAKDYLQEVLANDSERTCREYYVLLVTDGQESSPANFTQADLRNNVGQLRRVPVPAGPDKDIKTFVIGFGAGLGASDSGVSDLDVIARNGGTAMVKNAAGAVSIDNVNGSALSAVNQQELQSALNIVFSNITQGRFARSRPAVGTDGNRLYVSYFDRGGASGIDGGTPEWFGNMSAYEPTSAGTARIAWDLKEKVNNAAPSSRVLKAELANGTVTDFERSNSALLAGISSNTGLAQQTVDFVRNDGKGSDTNEKFVNGIPRLSRVGAFAFSAPLVVSGSPFSVNYGGFGSEAAASSYRDFKTANETRETRVMLGSYDGIFRGVRDNTFDPRCASNENSVNCPNGSEAWGYIPHESLQRLPLTLQQPTPIIDGPSSAADVCWPTSGTNAANCTADDWRTVVIGSYRSGAKAFFALDVTDPRAAFPTRLWSFTDNATPQRRLGFTYQPPMFGRVTVSGEKRWIAVAGGGLYDTNTPQVGDAVYMLDVKTGTAVQPGVAGAAGTTKFEIASSSPASTANTAASIQSFVARPALYKRPGVTDAETAFFANHDGQLWASRFPQNTSTPGTDWRPRKMYDPWDQDFQTDAVGNPATVISYLDKTTGLRVETGCETFLGKPGAVNAAVAAAANLTACTELAVRRPIFAQPKVASKFDASGVIPDVYVGTGDATELENRDERNFFFAVHDSNFALSPAANLPDTVNGSGKLLWIYTFDKGEKVVGNPTFSAGAIIVATYKPPVSGSTCKLLGDAYLYAFDPKTGEPRAALLDPNSPPGAPVYKSVLELKNAGAVSDLISFQGSNQIGFANGSGSPQLVLTRGNMAAGRVQGWRRVK
jgi:Neisseria PilC beta-propeller domain